MTSRSLKVVWAGPGVQRVDVSDGGNGSGAPGAGTQLLDWGAADLAGLSRQPYVSGAAAPALTTPGTTRRLRAVGTDVTANSRWAITDPASASWVDGELFMTIWGEKWDASLRTMAGFIMRQQVMPDGKVRAVVVWTDILFGPNIVYGSVWEVNPDGTGYVVGGGGVSINSDTVASIANTDGSRTSNVVTLTGLPFGHKIPAGAVVNVDVADATYDGNGFVTTGRAETTITYPQTAANDASSGAGTATAVWPLNLRARLDGNLLRYKIWRYLDPEPSWTDPVRAAALDLSAVTGLAGAIPTGPGEWGVLAGQLTTTVAALFGPLEMTRRG